MGVSSGHGNKPRNIIMRVGKARLTRVEYNIIAEGLNQIVVALEELEDRIAALEPDVET